MGKRVKPGSSKENPGASCKSIKEFNPMAPNGVYWIRLKQAVQMYCDMESGGWTMVGNVKVTNESQVGKVHWKILLSDDSSKLSEVTKNRFLLSSIGLNELQSHTNFTQMRFQCTKQWHNRTFDIFTAPTALGRSVVDYMLERISWANRPVTCNSYLRKKDDTSIMSNHCELWEGAGSPYGRRGWHDWYPHARPYGVLGGIPYKRWISLLQENVLCDDYGNENGYSSIGEWKYLYDNSK